MAPLTNSRRAKKHKKIKKTVKGGGNMCLDVWNYSDADFETYPKGNWELF